MASEREHDIAHAATAKKRANNDYRPTTDELKAVDQVLIEQARNSLEKVVRVTDTKDLKPISQADYDKEVRKGGFIDAKKDFRQDLTDKFVAALEEGRIPWQRPWNEVPMSAPTNAVSGNQYQGGNRLILTLTQMDRNYPDPRWLTFNQAKSLGGAVAKGEKGTQIEFWREKPFYQRKDVDVKLNGAPVKVLDEKDGQVTLAGGRTAPVSAFNVHHEGKEYGWGQAERRLNTLVGQTHTVFNVQQCQDLKIEPLAPTPESKLPMHERGELLLEGMKSDGVRFVEAPNRAFYRSSSDTISLPPRGDFKSEALFYGTALHESAHATGNEKRLNRDVGKNEFGSEGYAKEELVAEMTSAFLAAETGIPHDIEDHKSYIQSWADALKNDKNEIFRAAKLADQAANFMHDKAREVQMAKEQVQVQEVSKEVEKSPEMALREIWSAKGITTEKQDAMIKDIADKAKPGAIVGPFVIGPAEVDVDAMLARDRAAMEAGSMDRIYDGVMAKANKQLATGEISQSTYDRVAVTYGKPDMSGMKDLSTHDVRMGDYKPSPDSRVYVERGMLTIDHDSKKVSFGSAKTMETAIVKYGLTTKDLRTAYAVEQKQAEARLEIDHSEAKDVNARLAKSVKGFFKLADEVGVQAALEKVFPGESPESPEAQARNERAAVARTEPEPELDFGR